MLKNKKGYTLIELTVVIVLVGLMMTLAVPRFRYLLPADNLKSSARKMVALIKTTRDSAIRDQRPYDLNFDFESKRLWVDSPYMTEKDRRHELEKAFLLPEGVDILDIWFLEKGKRETGKNGIRFNRKGYIRPSLIHLGSDDGRKLTVVLSPFLGKVRVIESYVEFEEI